MAIDSEHLNTAVNADSHTEYPVIRTQVKTFFFFDFSERDNL